MEENEVILPCHARQELRHCQLRSVPVFLCLGARAPSALRSEYLGRLANCDGLYLAMVLLHQNSLSPAKSSTTAIFSA